MKTTTLIHHFLEQSARTFPDKTALIHNKVQTSYAEINSQANCLACWLSERITDIDARVVILLENSLEYVVSYYGIMKAGAIAVPLSTTLAPSSLSNLLQEIEPAVVISCPKYEQYFAGNTWSSCPFHHLILKNPKLNIHFPTFAVSAWNDIISEDYTNDFFAAISDESLSSIIYTSGSSGKPKGVMLSHRNVVSNTYSICESLPISENDIQMVVLPFCYVMGKSLLNTHIASGGTVVINNSFAFPATVLKDMVETGVTAFSGVPSTYAFLLSRSPLSHYRDRLPALRYCSQAGGHMPHSIKTELRKVLPEHTDIYIMYGATEASSRLSYLERDKFEEKMNSIGKPVPGVNLKVLNKNGNEAKPDEIGELVAAGPNIMQGYWKDPAETSRVLVNNTYLTGDLAYKDQDGYFYVLGRKDCILKVGGYRINPQEVEEILMDSQLFSEAVVVGIPDTLMGYKLAVLGVTKHNKCTKHDILIYCSQSMPKYMLPSVIQFTESVPKHHNGKINRSACLEQLMSYETTTNE